MEVHCRHCGSKTENLDERIEASAGRYFLKAVCKVCGFKKAARVKPPKAEEPAITEDTDEVKHQ